MALHRLSDILETKTVENIQQFIQPIQPLDNDRTVPKVQRAREILKSDPKFRKMTVDELYEMYPHIASRATWGNAKSSWRRAK